MKGCGHKKTCTRMFIKALEKQLQSGSNPNITTGEQIKTLWYGHVMAHHSAIKNECPSQ